MAAAEAVGLLEWDLTSSVDVPAPFIQAGPEKRGAESNVRSRGRRGEQIMTGRWAGWWREVTGNQVERKKRHEENTLSHQGSGRDEMI